MEVKKIAAREKTQLLDKLVAKAETSNISISKHSIKKQLKLNISRFSFLKYFVLFVDGRDRKYNFFLFFHYDMSVIMCLIS
jgi:hypothetical protein